MTDCSDLWPRDERIETALTHWAFVAGRLGADPALPRPFLICIRGAKPYALESHTLVHSPVYDDTGVLLVRDSYPVVFPMATHAYQARSKASPDVNRDGLGDVGSVRPGRYLLTDLLNGKEVIFHVTMPDGSPRLPCWRDFDGDKKLSPEEMQRSEDARTGAQVGTDGTWADSILLHGGLDSPPDAKHKYSIGCLTASVKWRALLAEKAKPSGGKIDCVLTGVDELLVHTRAAMEHST
jgi:hypothetical protein